MSNFLLFAALASGAALGVSAPAPGPLDLPGVRLGMPVQAWKALPFPGPASAQATPVCSNEPAARRGDLSADPADQRSGAIVCAYRQVIGRFSLPVALSLGPKLQVQRLRFTFRGGRLARVDYRISVNAFDDVTARLTKRYGPPAQLTRDSVRTEAGAFPRVRQVWSTSTTRIELVDPVPPFNQMGVELTAKPAAAGRKAS